MGEQFKYRFQPSSSGNFWFKSEVKLIEIWIPEINRNIKHHAKEKEDFSPKSILLRFYCPRLIININIYKYLRYLISVVIKTWSKSCIDFSPFVADVT